MEDDRLYAHRSWTGYCIYIIEFQSDGKHRVTVNRNSEQYTCDSIAEETDRLNMLLDWWSQPAYDHYGEWLTETVAALSKNK